MKDEDPSLAPSPTTPLTMTMTKPRTRENSDAASAGAGNGKGQYKFWVLAAIILLALWSMFTGSVTLKWSATNLTRFSDDFDSRILDDLDVLEVEEKEKVVRRMWDVYSHSHSHSRLPRFWCDAFQAAYEHLVSDAPGVRDAAISEIAKMSLRSLHLQKHRHPLQESRVQSTWGSRKMKQAESGLDIKADSNQ